MEFRVQTNPRLRQHQYETMYTSMPRRERTNHQSKITHVGGAKGGVGSSLLPDMHIADEYCTRRYKVPMSIMCAYRFWNGHTSDRLHTSPRIQTHLMKALRRVSGNGEIPWRDCQAGSGNPREFMHGSPALAICCMKKYSLAPPLNYLEAPSGSGSISPGIFRPRNTSSPLTQQSFPAHHAWNTLMSIEGISRTVLSWQSK